MELDNKKYVVDHLLSTKREGMEDLVAYMDEIGFFTAPASGGNHECCEFGLVQHTRNVMMNAENIGYALLGKEGYEKIRNSVIISSGLHDLGKCGDHDKPLYVPNMIKNKKFKKTDPSGGPEYILSEAKPYERNKELSPIPHSIRSIKIATLFIDLTDDEEWAIYAHDGLYDHAKYIIPGHETPLLMILHWADLWASKVTEAKER